MPFSIDGVLRNSQISLEKAATDKFGAVVEDFSRGALSSIGVSVPPAQAAQADVNRNDGSWYSTSYAAALAGGDYRPKLKFLFKIEFIFTEAAKQQFPELRAASANDFTFMIKSVERPKVDFEYEDDVNMYNNRTKVLKKIRHRDLTVVFLDDVGNRVFRFFRMMMMIHSPITRRQVERDKSLTPPTPSTSALLSTSGMSYTGTEPFAAHRGVVNSAFGNSIEAIRVKQIFVNPTAGLETASQMVVFDFMNPRIVSFDLDELTHESSDPNLLTMVFDYDWMEMVEVGALGTANTKYSGDYHHQAPGINGAPTDITSNKQSGAQGKGYGSNNGMLGQITESLTRIGGRAVQELTSDMINKAAKTIGGNGRFATAIGGIAGNSLGGLLGGTATAAIGGVFGTGPIAGIIDGAKRDASTLPRARSQSVTDSSTAGPDKPVAEAWASSAYTGTNPVADNQA